MQLIERRDESDETYRSIEASSMWLNLPPMAPCPLRRRIISDIPAACSLAEL